MSDQPTYEEKEKRLDEILERLDKSETPMDQLVGEAREAAGLIKSMNETIRGAKTEIAEILADMEQVMEGEDAPTSPM